MRTVSEIYAAYRIPALLQTHQLRVAAVGKMIIDNFDSSLDERNVILACLFHDMGNILKSDLSLFPETLEPEGLPYWKKVKADFARRYGPEEHHATIAIAHELHLPLQAVQLIDGVGFSKLPRTLATPSFEQKIVEYADTRVAPHSVVSQAERLKEARTRYAAKRHTDVPVEDTRRFDELTAIAAQIEGQIFARCRIQPEDITEATVQPLIEKLAHFQVA